MGSKCCGLISSTAPSLLRQLNTTWGFQRSPHSASVLTANASCIGVTNRKPWPMPQFNVSPPYQGVL
jgi:uncharacterized membrane protein (UPF0136 family)